MKLIVGYGRFSISQRKRLSRADEKSIKYKPDQALLLSPHIKRQCMDKNKKAVKMF